MLLPLLETSFHTVTDLPGEVGAVSHLGSTTELFHLPLILHLPSHCTQVTSESFKLPSQITQQERAKIQIGIWIQTKTSKCCVDYRSLLQGSTLFRRRLLTLSLPGEVQTIVTVLRYWVQLTMQLKLRSLLVRTWTYLWEMRRLWC